MTKRSKLVFVKSKLKSFPCDRTMCNNAILEILQKEFAKMDSKPLSVADEFYMALEEKNKQLIADACKRARLNNRNTVMARDL